VRLAGDRGLQVVVGRADRQAGGRVADGLEELEMAVGMSGLAAFRLSSVFEPLRLLIIPLPLQSARPPTQGPDIRSEAASVNSLELF